MENTITSKDVNFDAHPASNTGGTSEQTVTATIFNHNGTLIRLPSAYEELFGDLEIAKRIETSTNAAFIDTLSFTLKSADYYKGFPSSPAFTPDGEDLVQDISKHLETILGFGATKQREKGINFYSKSYELGNGWGHIAIGGVHQRDSIQIYLNGQGCLAAKNGWEQRLFDFTTTIQATITRVDLAADFFDGSYTVDKAVSDHIAGLFKTKNSPKNLSGERRGCWDFEVLGLPNTGRTYYVGTRESGKFFRIYEKGFQQARRLKGDKQFGDKFRTEFEKWTRVELELGNQNRIIPLDILTNAGQYLAGSVPALEFISEEQSRIKVKKKNMQATVATAKIWVKQQVGRWLYAFQELECVNEAGEYDNQKLATLIRSLTIEEIPRGLENPCHELSTSMDFSNPNDRQEYESEDSFIDRTLNSIGIIGKKIAEKTNYEFGFAPS